MKASRKPPDNRTPEERYEGWFTKAFLFGLWCYFVVMLVISLLTVGRDFWLRALLPSIIGILLFLLIVWLMVKLFAWFQEHDWWN